MGIRKDGKGLLNKGLISVAQRLTNKLAHFNLTVPCANLQAWLWMYRWTMDHAAIFQREARRMPGTLNTVAHQFAFRKRPAEMGAGFSHAKQSLSPTDQQYRRGLVHRARGFVFR